MERLARQMQHNGAVLAQGIEQHRLAALGYDLAHDEYAFGFEPLQVRQRGCRHHLILSEDEVEWRLLIACRGLALPQVFAVQAGSRVS
jgi:hypothetical protein